jgi:hypothetical protein
VAQNHQDQYQAHLGQPQALPKFINSGNSEIIEHELSAAEALNTWVWPVACWTIILINTFVAIIVVKDMWSSGYQPANHFFMTGAFTATLAAIALIYKVVLRGK